MYFCITAVTAVGVLWRSATPHPPPSCLRTTSGDLRTLLTSHIKTEAWSRQKGRLFRGWRDSERRICSNLQFSTHSGGKDSWTHTQTHNMQTDVETRTQVETRYNLSFTCAQCEQNLITDILRDRKHFLFETLPHLCSGDLKVNSVQSRRSKKDVAVPVSNIYLPYVNSALKKKLLLNLPTSIHTCTNYWVCPI